jgi:hypothetical protein
MTAAALSPLAGAGRAAETDKPAPMVLTARMHHLRIEGPREWSEFPERAESAHLELKFNARAAAAEQTLIVRQQDVKQTWLVRLNGKELGRLSVDENDMRLYFAVPAGMLADGENRLRIEQDPRRQTPDDIRLGEISLDPRPRGEVLSEASVEIEVLDVAEVSRLPLPARITIVNDRGALQTVGAASNEHLAVRPGIVYTAGGRARFGLPAGRYTIYAGRGFEYSLGVAEVKLAAGDTVRQTLKIRREVPTTGYVACDTHTHTLTHSGHGDATVQERMMTLAAEGIELPIATDHNRHIDHEPFARQMGVRRYFTPVIGNEVTTRVGHFNIFPVQAAAEPPDVRSTDWREIFTGIHRTPGVQVVILNHARDLHSGTRPFGPKLQNAAVGVNLEGWTLQANAMEVVNSGAVQSDGMQLVRDWMTQLNHGRMLTPVGASDSHDVGRHFVGQGRTYIRAGDNDPAAINVDEAVQNFLQGRVMVSYGLLAELSIDGRYGPGDLAPATEDRVTVGIRVLGPHWVRAQHITLFANGLPVQEHALSPSETPFNERGVIWSGDWDIPRPKHDVHLVAVALGPGIDGLYWKTAKPYQPTSPEWRSYVLGCSGALWLDADGDGRRTPAVEYARRLISKTGDNLPALLTGLAEYDEAVAAQAAHLWQEAGGRLLSPAAQEALGQAAPTVQRGVRAYLDAWRESQIARSETK